MAVGESRTVDFGDTGRVCGGRCIAEMRDVRVVQPGKARCKHKKSYKSGLEIMMQASTKQWKGVV